MTAHSVGFVYILSNASMPGLVKVGHTGLLADDRARKLFTTGVPEPFVVEFRLTSSSPLSVEREAHRLLDAHRYRPDREFFTVSISDAIAAVQAAAVEANGIGSWQGDKIHYIRSNSRLTARLVAGQVLVVLRYPGLFASKPEILDVWQAHADGDYIEMFGTGDSAAVAGLSDNDPDGDVDPVPYLDRSATAPNVSINGRERLVPGDRLVWIDRSDEVGEPRSVVFEMDSYCQVVGRTYAPQFTEDGYPLLLNMLVDSPSPPVADVVRKALSLPLPRSWAPAQDRDPAAWTEIGGGSIEPGTWLPQLRIPRKRRA